MIIVTGATGKFGSKAIQHLLDKGVAAREIAALARQQEDTQSLKDRGIQVRIGDYSDINSMVNAFQGVDKMLLVSSSDRGPIENRTNHHINAIKAAQEAKVKHIAYTSFVRKPGFESSAIADFERSHLASEKFLKESGIHYTILQNGIYQEMILAFMGEKVAETGTVLFPAAEGKASWVLREELAEVAVNVLTTEGHENKTYTLTHNASVGFEKIANYLSAAMNKDIRYHSPDPESFKAMMEKAGVPAMYIGMFSMWGTAIAEGMMDLEDTTLESLLGRKPTSVKQFIHRIYQDSSKEVFE